MHPSTSPPPRRPASLDSDDRADLKSLELPALSAWLESLGERPYRAKQIYKWLWQRGARSFDEMTDLSKALRATLAAQARISFLQPELVLRSQDGTTKFLWKLHDGHTIESVLIPDQDRLTLCMSSQAGCAMGCTFCLTGDLGLLRQLSVAEIANQPMQIGRQLPEGQRITNLVLMGMGEPLHNLRNLLPALRICLDSDGLNYSHRRITVSTSGLVPQMAQLGAALPVNLAVSLNATTEAQRNAVMPITHRYSLAALLQACRAYPLGSGKRITFEYVMLRGVNDTLEDAARLHKLLHGIKAKVNLIPYNENPDRVLLKRPLDADVAAFQHYLLQKGTPCSVRVTRGSDISAACGQLGRAAQQARDNGWLEDARRIAGLTPGV